jgi:hypothetical protein
VLTLIERRSRHSLQLVRWQSRFTICHPVAHPQLLRQMRNVARSRFATSTKGALPQKLHSRLYRRPPEPDTHRFRPRAEGAICRRDPPSARDLTWFLVRYRGSVQDQTLEQSRARGLGCMALCIRANGRDVNFFPHLTPATISDL